MIYPHGTDYIETKQIMLGKASIKPEFKILASWIDSTYSVKTINIIYDTISDDKPRLQICFEFEAEKNKFINKDKHNFNKKKQAEIAAKFSEFMSGMKLSEESPDLYNTNDTWVIFGAFEPIAKIEANEGIPHAELQKLQASLENPDLWQIIRCFSVVTFFVYTDVQLKKYETGVVKEEWNEKYFNLLQQYDEFGYFDRDQFSIFLDSKENLDTNYSGNFYYYYK